MSPPIPAPHVPPEPWKRAQPSFVCSADCRSPEHLRRAARQWDVEHAARYQRRGPATYCNVYLWDVTISLDCEIPHWVVGAHGEREELNALAVIGWLRGPGAEQGWSACSAEAARTAANAGRPVVVAWENPDHLRSSHVALALPSPAPAPLRIAQAGWECLYDVPVARGFGGAAPLEYFTHL